MDKGDIKNKYRLLRRSQLEADKKVKDREIFGKLTKMTPFKAAREFFTYISHDFEVSTDEIIEEFFEKKTVLVPRILKGEICLHEIKDEVSFVKGKFGIREPVVCVPRNELKKIAVAIIPGIAFDLTGHRIGFGGGYFDRFLKKVHCTTIGLAYEFQIVDKVPTNEYDVAVDWIVTEKRVIRCEKSQL
ncbi:MAG: 5-formyltetrahydrofolate cyclo-ligase [Patescibacteria group bacterium]